MNSQTKVWLSAVGDGLSVLGVAGCFTGAIAFPVLGVLNPHGAAVFIIACLAALVAGIVLHQIGDDES